VRHDLFTAAEPADAAEISRLRREVVEARRTRRSDQLALEDAADRTEFVVRHTLIYRVGSVVEHYSRGRVGRALERRTAHKVRPAPPSYPVSIEDQYSRWYVLERRKRWEQPPRWVADSVGIVIIGDEGVESTMASINVQRRPSDVVTSITTGDELPDALAALAALRPAPRWLMVLNAGDQITPDCISMLIFHAGDGAGAFADQDRVDESGRHVEPWLKGEELGVFSPLGRPAVGEAAMLRRSSLPPIDPALGAGSLQSALLHLFERGEELAHLPTVLLSRPLGRASYVTDAQLAKAATTALVRRGWGGSAMAGAHPGTVEWRAADPTTWPSVQIVIPTRDRVELLERCISSIESKTEYENWTLTIVDNDSSDPDTLAYLARSPYQVVKSPGKFHFPAVVNAGAAAGDEEFVLLLNNDCEVLDARWLADLVRVAALPSVGIVGATLVGSDGQVNHAGIAVAGTPCQLFYPGTHPSDDATIHSTHDALAVTGACQLVRRELWDALGGHDESFEVECSDVDISLRARQLGWRTVVVASSPVQHLEKQSRGELHDDPDGPAFAYRWGLGGDFVDPYVTPLVHYDPGPRFQLPELP
jgi:GT2 family glycosyltransferase